ncbi:uncharacterized protein METZ01_LOCUS459007 [marine metagenome]|uniref:Uncharacterized protein n=1 Tax=marine metagenome TaxID=408172 RepID=A0A383AEX7_9ZZZZ
MKNFKEYFLTEDPTMWPWMWKDNKGEFWRGSGKEGKGSGLGALGAGIYFTWDEGMAKAFAEKFGGKVSKWKIKKGLKIMDAGGDYGAGDKEWVEIKKKMGFKNPKDWSNDRGYAKTLTHELKRAGYDGALSDNKATGIVIFDKKNVKEIK